MLLKFLGLIAIVSVAMCLVPGGAHFFELANKLSMSQPEYMTVQKIYAGWASFGVTVVAALLLTLLHTFMVRRDRTAFSSPLLRSSAWPRPKESFGRSPTR